MSVVIAIDLYGFYTCRKEMFELLISVSGMVQNMPGYLSGIQIEDLKEALKAGNISRLISIPV